MTHDDRSLERAARTWLEAGPTQAPDRAVEAALLRIDTTTQERGPVLPWRLPTMNPAIRLAGAALVAVLAVGVAVYAFRPASNSGYGPSPSVAGTPSPNPPPSGDVPLFPASPFPDPSGAALPAELIGRVYRPEPAEVSNGRQLVLTLRSANDPHCVAMYQGRSTCFTVLWSPFKESDPGARGPARIVGGNLVLGFALVPFDLPCVGSSATYAIDGGGATLRGINPPACTFRGFVELQGAQPSSSP
jgi:hypothetical protein